MDLLLDDPSEQPAFKFASVGVALSDARVAERVVRILRVATQMPVQACAAAALGSLPGTPVVVCDERQIELVLTAPGLGPIVVCDRDGEADIATRAVMQSRLNHIIGWCSFESTPRAWELAYAVRSALGLGTVDAAHAAISAAWAVAMQWRPHSPTARDHAVADVRARCEALGIASRLAGSIGTVAHELVMNALYDAPVDAGGAYLYAGDRSADIALSDEQAPALTLRSDGQWVALSVRDPFGSLGRERLFESLSRVTNKRGIDALDRSHGGAGLGLAQVLRESLAIFFATQPGRYTEVTAVFSADLSPRQHREATASIHFVAPTQGRAHV
ncbi:ATP-binding protein [Haliangium ochraceum]|uniref:Uncharacterized protein n=1 Tax=Haliangium ochraceum (strain DSM 14365 / JCM 11303 / SMP-2) TaxID=502025 RepID=D0LVU0_HALO1|nr:ATP-binding protein [Haliangium ochraceum]ACY14074.1 conserved hypothetical protein [Haliangium ochraceum DSM 14365]